MDGYPLGSLDHNVPLLVVSGLQASEPPRSFGLGSELDADAILLRSDLPPLESKDAKVLLQYLNDIDSRQDGWNGRDHGSGYKFRVVPVGRSFLLPPRRASLPPHLEPPTTPPVFHSPFSPLSPSSPLYPDGIIDAQWLHKHQGLVPSIFVVFYSLDPDPTQSVLHDNMLKTDIANVRSTLARSAYRTRLAVVMLGERPSPPLRENLHERLDGIRKGAGLDPKTIFYIPPQDSPSDLAEAVDAVLTTMYAQALEYYRDLGRHARKKRGRGTVPPPTVPPTSGTSQTLSLPGWHVRYDFKSAIFAEFRQEIDSALRLFEQCYETLLGPDLLDIIPNWSPRWNEARLLTDIVATRSLRCLLWAGQTTTAVRRWHAHRDRIRDLVDQRGRGTANYGWEAWEARWAIVMAQLIDRAELLPFAAPTLALYILPEKSVVGERLEPWEMLHHTGYWYRAAAAHTAARRALARAMPDEDRQAPDSAPASHVASKAYTYDTYLCPEPHEEHPLKKEGGFDHSQMIIHCLMEARSQFQARGQDRVAAELVLQSAKEMLSAGAWEDVVAILCPLWEAMSFRKDGWWLVVEDVDWTLRAAAVQAGRADLVMAIDWELLDRKFTLRQGWTYDMSRSLQGLPAPAKRTVARTDDSIIASFASASFAFRGKEGRSGEICEAQLAITSNAFPNSVPVTLQRLTIKFGDRLRTIVIEHADSAEREQREQQDSGEDDKVLLVAVPLNEERPGDGKSDHDEDKVGEYILKGAGDLELVPGRANVYELSIPLREPGLAKAGSVTLSIDAELIEFHHTIPFQGSFALGDVWFGPSPGQRKIIRPDAHLLHVQPRPPKLEVKNAQVERQFYTNEPIQIPLEMVNAEMDNVEARLSVYLLGQPLQPFTVCFQDTERVATMSSEGSAAPALPMGTIAAGATTSILLRLEPEQNPKNYDVTVKVSYHLVSDPATPIIQTTTFRVPIVNAFEASFDMLPRVHAGTWPSLFNYETASAAGAGAGSGPPHPDSAAPLGLVQKWCLHCQFASFASDDLVIVSMDAEVVACAGGVSTVTAKRPAIPAGGLDIAPHTPREAQFDMVVQKASLDERGPVSIDIVFIIRWRRAGASEADPPPPVNTTSIMVPQRYVVLGTEPRVLASMTATRLDAAWTEAGAGLVVYLDITIENGSSHFLTFGIGMEPSDEFAFSGPKQMTLHVLPISRRVVSFRLVPLVGGRFVKLPLVVRDKYFQKTLKILPTEGMRLDKEGLFLWIPGEADA